MPKLSLTILIVVAVLCLQPAARGEIIFSDSDTMSIEHTEGYQGESVNVTIFMANPSLAVGGIAHRIEYDQTLLEIDTVTCIERGCNLEMVNLNFSEPGVIWIARVSQISSLIPIGSGPVMILKFNIDPAAPDTVTAVDFVNLDFYNNAWADSTGIDLIIPVLENGSIAISSQTDIVSVPNLPRGFSMSQNYPNPFNNKTTISFDLRTAQEIELVVYDLLGKEVAILYSGPAGTGVTTVNWNGNSSSGSALPSGIYFYRLETSRGETLTRRMTLLK